MEGNLTGVNFLRSSVLGDTETIAPLVGVLLLTLLYVKDFSLGEALCFTRVVSLVGVLHFTGVFLFGRVSHSAVKLLSLFGVA